MKTSDLFIKEINLIKNKHMRDIVENTLNAAPQCIQTIPASSSKKYHADYAVIVGEILDDGTIIEGGLSRHIKATVGIAYSMIESDVLKGLLENEVKEYSDIYEDIVYTALILHDCCKPDDTPKHGTRFDHPIVGANLFNKTAMEYVKNTELSNDDMGYIKTTIPLIFKCIKSHMGKYTTAPYAKGIELPKPMSNLEWFVHSCDLLSSRKYIEFDFNKYYETLKI